MKKRKPEDYLRVLLFITVLGAIGSVAFNFYIESSNIQVGSFEYVRRGEDLLGKNRFREAIAIFEKAHESSPENNAIAVTLADAYAKYGDSLAGAGQYEKAVRCLERARDIKPCSAAAQALAVMYSRKAKALALTDPAQAKADFDSARAAAENSAVASKNLGISLFNDAVEEAKAGRDEIAIMLLKQSYLVYKNGDTMEMMGDIYYRGAKFDSARFYYGKALALDAGNGKVRGKLRKAAREAVLAGRAHTDSFEHFELSYGKNLTVDADSVRDVLDRCYYDVGQDLKYFPESKTKVFLYSEGDFNNIFKVSSATRAFYDGSIRIPLPDRVLRKEAFMGHIYHEYTHAAISAQTGNNCPVWLNEGIAVREEYKNKDGVIVYLFANLAETPKFSLETLSTAFDFHGKNERQLSQSYLVAYTAAKYIIDTWGMDGMRGLLSRIKEGRHVINAIDDEFLLSEQEFEKRWQNYTAKRYLKGRY